MKGMIFTEFLDLVEDKFGVEMVDAIISESNLKSKGIYTAIGTYDFSEMLQLLQRLNANSGIPIDDLLLLYGEHFFKVIQTNYKALLNTYKDPIEMLASIEDHIHVEVRKIYPDAELPEFIVQEKTKNALTMVYKSSRAMHYFGLGLMNKTFAHFNTSATIITEKIKEDGTEVKFVINKN